jgi:hypothetical protein
MHAGHNRPMSAAACNIAGRCPGIQAGVGVRRMLSAAMLATGRLPSVPVAAAPITYNVDVVPRWVFLW